MIEKAAIVMGCTAVVSLYLSFAITRNKLSGFMVLFGAYLLMLSGLLYSIGAGVVGMATVLSLLGPESSSTHRMMAGVTGFLLGWWAGGLALQVAVNIVNVATGQPMQKIKWIPGRKRKKLTPP